MEGLRRTKLPQYQPPIEMLALGLLKARALPAARWGRVRTPRIAIAEPPWGEGRPRRATFRFQGSP